MTLTRHEKIRMIEAIKAKRRVQAVMEGGKGEAGEAVDEPVYPVLTIDPTMGEKEEQLHVTVVTPARREIESLEPIEEDIPHLSCVPSATSNSEHSVSSPTSEATVEAGVAADVHRKLRPEEPKQISPDISRRRDDIFAGDERRSMPRSRKVLLKDQNAPKPKHKHPRGRRNVHHRTRTRGFDDDSTVESRPERRSRKSGSRKSDGIASALDPFIDFLMDDRSIGEDSISVQSDRTHDRGGIVKEMEDFLWSQMDCANVTDWRNGLESRTFSMDESTLSDGNHTYKPNKRSHRRAKSWSSQLQASADSLIRVASEELSTIVPDDEDADVPDDENVVRPSARVSRKVRSESYTTTSYGGDRDLNDCVSFESTDVKPLCDDIYQIANDLIELDSTADGSSRIDMFSAVIRDATLRAQNMKFEFKSDASAPSSFQTSMVDSLSFPSTLLSSLRGVTALSDTQPGADGGDVGVTSVPSGETHSVVANGDNRILEEDKSDVYAPAEEKSDASFFTRNGASHKDCSKNAFQEALLKLKDSLDSTYSSDKIQELQASIKAMKLVPDDGNWSPQKLYEALTSTSNVAVDEDTSNERPSIVGTVKTILSCGRIDDVPFDEVEQQSQSEESVASKIRRVLTCSDSKPEDAILTEESVYKARAAESNEILDDEHSALPARDQMPSLIQDEAEGLETERLETEGLDVGDDNLDMDTNGFSVRKGTEDDLDPAIAKEEFEVEVDMFTTPVKVAVSSETPESSSHGTPETSNSTEDEADDPPLAPVDFEETQSHFLGVVENSQETEATPVVGYSTMDNAQDILSTPVVPEETAEDLEGMVDVFEDEDEGDHEAEATPSVPTALEETESHFLDVTGNVQQTTEDTPVRLLSLEANTARPEEVSPREPEPYYEQESVDETDNSFIETPSTTTKKTAKKWAPLRRVVRPLFGKKKADQQPLVSSRKSSSKPHGNGRFYFDPTTTESAGKSISTPSTVSSGDISPEIIRKSARNVTTENPFDPSSSGKSKRETWRNTRGEDFDEIITKNARADDWGFVSPEYSNAQANSTVASF